MLTLDRLRTWLRNAPEENMDCSGVADNRVVTGHRSALSAPDGDDLHVTVKP